MMKRNSNGSIEERVLFHYDNEEQYARYVEKRQQFGSDLDGIRAAVAAEREACAKIALDRAKVCQDAIDKGDTVGEVHALNEALHIERLIRERAAK